MLCREMRPIHMHQDSIVYAMGRMSPGLFLIKSGIVGAFIVSEPKQLNERPPLAQAPNLNRGSSKSGSPAPAPKPASSPYVVNPELKAVPELEPTPQDPEVVDDVLLSGRLGFLIGDLLILDKTSSLYG